MKNSSLKKVLVFLICVVFNSDYSISQTLKSKNDCERKKDYVRHLKEHLNIRNLVFPYIFEDEEGNFFDRVKILFSLGYDSNAQDGSGQTSLHYISKLLSCDFIRNDDYKYAQLLLKKKADVNLQDNAGKTP